MRTLAGVSALALLCVGCSGSTDTPQGSGGSGSGSGGRGSSGGAGVVQPSSSNVFVDQIVMSKLDKIDLLFMIDNSPSMADKQEILNVSVPLLLARLRTPLCVDSNGQPTGAAVQADGTCGAGRGVPEFAPIGDIHIGVVSSSLGAHGGSSCSPQGSPELDDRAHLIGTQRSGLTTWQNSGFLAWDPTASRNTPPGESDPKKLVTDFAAMVRATGERGCGYEASLESWYRFLIDPEPPASVAQVGGLSVRQGIDSELLAQRAAFLRPDSLLAIVMLSDENDCSIRDDGLGWMVSSAARMPKATAACSSNPNDVCCRSCSVSESSPPSGCPAISADPMCKDDGTSSPVWDALHDAANLRCYQQQQRFGLDLLYPTERYVAGLTEPSLKLPSNPSKMVQNPLFAAESGRLGRDRSLVFLAGIVGVPWQDIATTESLTSPSVLKYLTSSELLEKDRWRQVVGDPSASPPKPPSDPFMIESTEPRLGSNPNMAIQTTPATSTNPKANAINGHEHNIPQLDDLQYACTFPLITPRECVSGDVSCDCAPGADGSTEALQAANSPLCQPLAGGVPGTTQYFAKAYPGTRQLRVLKDIGANAIAASICPKIVTAATGSASSDPNYGYNPAISAIVDRLKEALRTKCLPRPITTVSDKNGSFAGTIACSVIEVQKSNACDCGQPGRAPAPAALVPSVFSRLKDTGSCGDLAGQSKCDAANFCMCEIHQETGEDLDRCVANATPDTPGFCYIDDSTSSALQSCPKNQQQVLRFVEQSDAKLPADGALVFLACPGATIDP